MLTLEELEYREPRHLYVRELLDYLDKDRRLQQAGIETLAEALRDVVRAMRGGSVEPRAAVAWIGAALRRPIVVREDQLEEACLWARDREWFWWSGAQIGPTAFTPRTGPAAPTKTASPSPATTGLKTGTAVVPGAKGVTPNTAAVQSTHTAQTTATPATRTRTLAEEPVVDGHAESGLVVGAVVVGEQRWRLLRLAGEGGMGRVWEAEAVDSVATRVAIKTVSAPTATNRAALDRELRLLRTLQRADYFPVIHDAFTADGNLHIVMDWVPGKTLDRCVEDDGLATIDRSRFFHWMEQVADRLAFLHAWPGRPVLFRDLKPSNILYDAETGRLRLVDFGIGHLAHPEQVGTVRAGTEGFMAPEVLHGQADERTDVFAFGRLGLYLLFKSYQFSTLARDSRPPHHRERALQQKLVAACMDACQPDPARRPTTILAALRAFWEASTSPDEARELPGDPCPTCKRARPRDRIFCPSCGAAAAAPPAPGSWPTPDLEFEASPVRAAGVLGARTARAYEELVVIRANADLTALRCLPHIEVEPYDYQRDAAVKVLSHMGGRAMIADDVGLGKTIEAGLIMKEYLIRGLARKTLVVAPAGLLLEQLCEEFRTKFKILFREYRSNGDLRDQNQYVGPAGLAEADHVAVSLATLRRAGNVDRFAKAGWDFVLVDECHHIKQRRSQSYKAVRQLVARYTVFMSATPFSGVPEELWTVYSALRPGCLGELRAFLREYDDSKTQGIRDQIRSMTIRRRRREVMVRFPTRAARSLAIAMTGKETDLYLRVVKAAKSLAATSLQWIQPVLQISASYEAIRRSAMFPRFPLELRTELQSLSDADHPKVRTFLERFVDRLPKGEKVIVFTHFQESQRALLRLLEKRERSALALVDASPEARSERLSRFRTDPRLEFLICGEGAGEGLNLQFCGLLVNLDLPWNPMRLEQRIGRIQRLGQRRRSVTVLNLVLQGTIEDRVLQILERKLGIFSGMLGDTEQILGGLFEASDEKDGESFEHWIAGSILDDGTLDTRRLGQLEALLGQSTEQVKRRNAAEGHLIDNLLGGHSSGKAGGEPTNAPNQKPVDLSFLDAP